jgi:hypothetical protein
LCYTSNAGDSQTKTNILKNKNKTFECLSAKNFSQCIFMSLQHTKTKTIMKVRNFLLAVVLTFGLAVGFMPAVSAQAVAPSFDINKFGRYISVFPNATISTNTTFNISGALPVGTTPPSGTVYARVQGSSSFVACTFIGVNFGCDNINSGTVAGKKAIQVKLDSSAWRSSGRYVYVNRPVVVPPVITPVPGPIANLGNYMTCSSYNVVKNTYVSCSGRVPDSFVVPNPSVTVTLGTQGSNVVYCNFVGPTKRNFGCDNINVGSVPGTYTLKGRIGGGNYSNLNGQVFVVSAY